MDGDQQHNIGQPSGGESARPQATQNVPPGRSRRLSREEARVGEVLSGRFRLIGLIGKGGMAVVYKAEDLLLGSTVAIKMLLSHVEEDDSMVERFIREAKASSRVMHPNLMKLLDYGEDENGSPFLVVEYLPGKSLATLQKEQKVLGVNNTIHIFAQISEAVAAAHGKGIIHRDLKPSNVMLIESEETEYFVKVVDFGLAKQSAATESQQLTQTGEVFGSPLYMSPEQCRGDVLDYRSDIYSLGIMLYEALTGKVPFYGENMVATISKHMTEAPLPFQQSRPDLYIPEKLEAVVMKALSKSPVDRHASMNDFYEDLLNSVPGRAQSLELRSAFAVESQEAPLNVLSIPGDRVPLYLVLALVSLIAIVGVSALLTSMIRNSSSSGAGGVATIEAPATVKVTPAKNKVVSSPVNPISSVNPVLRPVKVTPPPVPGVPPGETVPGKDATGTATTKKDSSLPDDSTPARPAPANDRGSKPASNTKKPPRTRVQTKSGARTTSSAASSRSTRDYSGSPQQNSHWSGNDLSNYHLKYHRSPRSDSDRFYDFESKHEGKYSK
ncbi:MAG: serine/threonine protein kinase [Candidatus Obscuribacterales bacterium]|nr:serine/threonine protein kinase [Candidatus Obscuribacterales bacterium]